MTGKPAPVQRYGLRAGYERVPPDQLHSQKNSSLKKHPDVPEFHERVSLPFSGARARFFCPSPRPVSVGSRARRALRRASEQTEKIPPRPGHNRRSSAPLSAQAAGQNVRCLSKTAAASAGTIPERPGGRRQDCTSFIRESRKPVPGVPPLIRSGRKKKRAPDRTQALHNRTAYHPSVFARL